MSSVKKIRVGDFVTLKVKRWRIPEDAQFEITEVQPDDPTIFVGTYNGVRYQIFAEHVIKIFRRIETFVLS